MLINSYPIQKLKLEGVEQFFNQNCGFYTPSLILTSDQCEQIGRFIALWATFQSRWQQLFCLNCPHCSVIFVKVSKSFIFRVKSFWATFRDIWQLFTGHTASYAIVLFKLLSCFIFKLLSKSSTQIVE